MQDFPDQNQKWYLIWSGNWVILCHFFLTIFAFEKTSWLEIENFESWFEVDEKDLIGPQSLGSMMAITVIIILTMITTISMVMLARIVERYKYVRFHDWLGSRLVHLGISCVTRVQKWEIVGAWVPLSTRSKWFWKFLESPQYSLRIFRVLR